jgi:hypothetical protein
MTAQACPHCGGELRITTRVLAIARHSELLEHVLAVVREHGPLKGGQVATRAHRRRADVLRALHEAEAAGLIRRDEHGRWVA